jgi:hypothetical protein
LTFTVGPAPALHFSTAASASSAFAIFGEAEPARGAGVPVHDRLASPAVDDNLWNAEKGARVW